MHDTARGNVKNDRTNPTVNCTPRPPENYEPKAKAGSTVIRIIQPPRELLELLDKLDREDVK